MKNEEERDQAQKGVTKQLKIQKRKRANNEITTTWETKDEITKQVKDEITMEWGIQNKTTKKQGI